MRTLTNPRLRPVVFVALVVALSVPLWVAAQAMDATTVLPMPLPLSALQFVCVLWAAALVTRWGGEPAGALLARGGDMSRLPGPGWRVGVFAVMPIVVGVAFPVSTWVAGGVSTSPTPLLAPVLDDGGDGGRPDWAAGSLARAVGQHDQPEGRCAA